MYNVNKNKGVAETAPCTQQGETEQGKAIPWSLELRYSAAQRHANTETRSERNVNAFNSRGERIHHEFGTSSERVSMFACL